MAKKTSPAEKFAAAKAARGEPKGRGGKGVPHRKILWPQCLLKEKRLALGLTLLEVQEATGVSAATQNNTERGTDVGLSNAVRLAIFFGCEISDIWPGLPEEDPDAIPKGAV